MYYLQQFERVKRYLLKINPKSLDHGDQTEYEDNLWSFFIHAWHLKDWIRYDTAIKNIPIEKIVKNYNSLKVCADLANRAKHLNLKTSRVDAKHLSTDVTIDLHGRLNDILQKNEKSYLVRKGCTSRYNYVFEDSFGKKYKAISLAKDIVRDWEDIIKKYIEVK